MAGNRTNRKLRLADLRRSCRLPIGAASSFATGRQLCAFARCLPPARGSSRVACGVACAPETVRNALDSQKLRRSTRAQGQLVRIVRELATQTRTRAYYSYVAGRFVTTREQVGRVTERRCWLSRNSDAGCRLAHCGNGEILGAIGRVRLIT
jgi:hypothetical protein